LIASTQGCKVFYYGMLNANLFYPRPSMSLCINPSCSIYNKDQDHNNRFCQSCGSNLLLEDRYQVRCLLSDKTGFGKIYEATEGGKPKILKVLKENLNNEPKAVELFQREAEALKCMNHPGIPKVDDYFQYQTTNGLILHCIAMEKIDGLNLEQWLEQPGNQPITQYEAIVWLTQLAEILDTVHKNKWFHRDIKPGNIMLRPSPSGQLVLIDFGTAREMTYTYLAANQKGGKITQVISQGYTPPEQAIGQPVQKSDFFALGRTFVHLLTGKHPLDMYDRNNDVLNWRSHTSGISDLLLDFIDKLMARELGKRPQNTQEILQELEEIKRKLIPPPPPRPPRKKFPVVLVTGAAAAFVGLAVLAMVNPCLFGLPTCPPPPPQCPPDCPHREEPEIINDVVYFPEKEGRDSQGKTARFKAAILSAKYRWIIGSEDTLKDGSTGTKIPLSQLKQKLKQQNDIYNKISNPNGIISVGTASCEGYLNTEEARAMKRAKQIHESLVKKLFSVQYYYVLNLGQFTKDDCRPDPEPTAFQRSLIMVGVRKKDPRVNLDEAVRDYLENQLKGFNLDYYSLGSKDKFKTEPIN
jgi:eukaryotic-like serine/threonine-protein kinase